MNIKKEPTAVICLSPSAGGMELDSIKLAEKLSSDSNIVLIAKKNSFIDSTATHYTSSSNITLETISFLKTISLNIIIKARMIIQKYNIRNVIFFGASELKSLYFSFLGLNINLIVRHGTTKSTPKKDFFHALIYSKVNYHVSISKHLQNNVKQIIPFGKDTKEKLIYPSLELTQPKLSNSNQIRILHVGRIVRGKGQMDAIKACKILVENNINFTFKIVGSLDEKYLDEFNNFYNDCPYRDKIILEGFTHNVYNYITNSDIFLFPSYGEGFGNAFAEALSHNLVCIAYSNTTFKEFKSLGYHMHLVEDRNIKDLSEKLLTTVKYIENEKKSSEKNYKLSKKIFNIKQEVNTYKEILV